MRNYPEFELGPIRPPDEANSLLIRTTRGCPWNKCKFCTLFSGSCFSIRTVDEIKSDIYRAKEHYGNRVFENCFLQDGDSFAMKTDNLLEVLKTLKEVFPSLKQISSYGRAGSLITKSPQELKMIHDAGLNMLYCGMESGSDKILEIQNKGTTSEKLIKACVNAREAGMKTMLFMILGLGGKENSDIHINESARVINSINPEMIRILTLAAKPGTPLGDLVDSGTFTPLSEVEMIDEQRKLLSGLNGIKSQFGNYHSIDLLTELKGNLPEEREQMLKTMDKFLNMTPERQENFIMGKRIWWYGSLDDMDNISTFNKVQSQLDILKADGVNPEDFFHQARQRII